MFFFLRCLLKNLHALLNRNETEIIAITTIIAIIATTKYFAVKSCEKRENHIQCKR
jgi:hypothetical protein